MAEVPSPIGAFIKTSVENPEIADYDDLAARVSPQFARAVADHIHQNGRPPSYPGSLVVSELWVEKGDDHFVGKVIGAPQTKRPIQVELRGMVGGDNNSALIGIGGIGPFSMATEADRVYVPYRFAPKFIRYYGEQHAADRFFDTPDSSITGVEIAANPDSEKELAGYLRVVSRLVSGLVQVQQIR